MEWTSGLPFDQSCKALRAEGWSVKEIASFEERTEADVRKALGLSVEPPTSGSGSGLLPYLGI